ncbi:MAG: hypothetical protein KDD59_02055 [Bdellovibrionales bacterium]|nr:hypothetical protein [Bdellovibrionales bacterium]
MSPLVAMGGARDEIIGAIDSSLVIHPSVTYSVDPTIARCGELYPNGWSQKVDRVVEAPCRDDYNLETKGKYTLFKENGRLGIEFSIYFHYTGELENFEKAKLRLAQSLECVGLFFERSGFQFRINYEVGMGMWGRFFGDKNYDVKVNLIDSGAAEKYSWPLYSQGGKGFKTSLPFSKMCALHIHELLHHTGLHDTYPIYEDISVQDKHLCDGRQRVEDLTDIMNNAYVTHKPPFVFLMPYAIQTILEPVCR